MNNTEDGDMLDCLARDKVWRACTGWDLVIGLIYRAVVSMGDWLTILSPPMATLPPYSFTPQLLP